MFSIILYNNHNTVENNHFHAFDNSTRDLLNVDVDIFFFVKVIFVLAATLTVLFFVGIHFLTDCIGRLRGAMLERGRKRPAQAQRRRRPSAAPTLRGRREDATPKKRLCGQVAGKTPTLKEH